MKKVFVIASIFGLLAATASFAGLAWEPPDVDPSGESDLTPALVLLGLIGVVIASSQMGGLATRNEATMLPEEPVDE